MEENLLRLK